MEDPVRFDIWAVLERGHTSDAVAWQSALRPALTQQEVRQLVNGSAMRGEWILALPSAPWHQADALRREPPLWCSSLRLYQEGWGPEDRRAAFCERHQFFYGGCLGCHVCSGFYVP